MPRTGRIFAREAIRKGYQEVATVSVVGFNQVWGVQWDPWTPAGGDNQEMELLAEGRTWLCESSWRGSGSL